VKRNSWCECHSSLLGVKLLTHFFSDLRPHPNVVQMLGVSSDGPYPVMILEFCDGGSLDQKLFDPSQPFTLSEQFKTVSGIAKGLYHLHQNQIVHRDMAARNILLNFNQPKISDFGLSRLVNDTQKGTTRSNVGPIRWMSPESLKNQTYSPK
jgi:serine/threonine protein kinase